MSGIVCIFEGWKHFVIRSDYFMKNIIRKIYFGLKLIYKKLPYYKEKEEYRFLLEQMLSAKNNDFVSEEDIFKILNSYEK